MPSDRDASPLPTHADRSPPVTPAWRLPNAYAQHHRRQSSSSGYMARLEKIQRSASNTLSSASSTYNSLTGLQRILLWLTAVFGLIVLVLFLRFGEQVFVWIAPLAEKWRAIQFGWMILWAATFFVSFPPLIGYMSCVTIAGFVYGFPLGWFIAASATVLGSTASFLASRTVLSGFVHRLVAHDRRFTALSLTLKHDGLKLLVMIRLCPLPYSLSNGAIATFPTVTVLNFMAATALATPKLLIHVFIGSRLAKIGGEQRMDAGTKMLNWISIFIGLAIGAGTGWFIYRQTKRRAAELEAQERGTPGGHTADIDFDEEDFDEDDAEGLERRSRDGPAALPKPDRFEYTDGDDGADQPGRPSTQRAPGYSDS